jgi:ABC-type multidrug transport system fused ATPase/permease subunit
VPPAINTTGFNAAGVAVDVGALPACCQSARVLAREPPPKNCREQSQTVALQSIIGERGFKISGGQRQRLAIARAFLKDSKIVILDEATSAVDSESENQIHRAMELLMSGRTVFLIAHRLRSAVTADLIVVMDRGRIVETGRHTDLMRRDGAYARLFNEQARGLSLEPQPGPGIRHRMASL